MQHIFVFDTHKKKNEVDQSNSQQYGYDNESKVSVFRSLLHRCITLPCFHLFVDVDSLT